MSVTPSNSLPIGPASPFNMLEDGEDTFWFHHVPSFPGLNPLLYKDLISTASSIDIWDPYFHHTKDHVIFSNVANNVIIRILTAKGLTNAQANYLIDVRDAVKTVIPDTKNSSFCVGAINTALKPDWSFHDRFLILDGTVYIVGASVEYNHVSKGTTGMYKVSNPVTANFIISQFNSHWVETEKCPSSGIQSLHP